MTEHLQVVKSVEQGGPAATPPRLFVIATVECEPLGNSTMIFTSQDSQQLFLTLDGDCCSVSYFEENSINDAKGLVGEQLCKVEEVAARLTDDNDEEGATRYHAIKITTNKQEVILDWRNDSNGCYDGTCDVSWYVPEVQDFEPEPKDRRDEWA